LITEKDGDRTKKDKDLLNTFSIFTYSQHQVKQHANLTSTKHPSKLENFKKLFFITKFALAQTKLDKFYSKY